MHSRLLVFFVIVSTRTLRNCLLARRNPFPFPFKGTSPMSPRSPLILPVEVLQAALSVSRFRERPIKGEMHDTQIASYILPLWTT
jgi:hypothetical protein